MIRASLCGTRCRAAGRGDSPGKALRRRAFQALSLIVLDPGVEKVLCGVLCRADGAGTLRQILEALPREPSSQRHAASFELLQDNWTDS